jgi:hypothetical protein
MAKLSAHIQNFIISLRKAIIACSNKNVAKHDSFYVMYAFIVIPMNLCNKTHVYIIIKREQWITETWSQTSVKIAFVLVKSIKLLKLKNSYTVTFTV